MTHRGSESTAENTRGAGLPPRWGEHPCALFLPGGSRSPIFSQLPSPAAVGESVVAQIIYAVQDNRSAKPWCQQEFVARTISSRLLEFFELLIMLGSLFSFPDLAQQPRQLIVSGGILRLRFNHFP